MAASWLDSLIRYTQVYATKAEIRNLTPVPSFGILVYCTETSSIFRWAIGDGTADDDSTVLAPANAIDQQQGRWRAASFSGGTLAGDVSGAAGANTVAKIQGRAVTSTAPTNGQGLVWNGSAWAPGSVSGGNLSGDAQGAPGSNTVTHVTGVADTKLEGSNTVALKVNGTDILTASSSLVTIGTETARIAVAAGVPVAALPNGSIQLRTDGTNGATGIYTRQVGGWLPVGDPAGITMGGDVTGTAAASTVVKVTGGTNGPQILRPSANPTTAPASGALVFPSQGSAGYALDQFRWLQANGCCPVLWGGYYEINSGAVTAQSFDIMTFGPPTSSYVQGFVGKVIVTMYPAIASNAGASNMSYVRWGVPFGAFTYDSGATHTMNYYKIGRNKPQGNPTVSNGINSGVELYAVDTGTALNLVDDASSSNATTGLVGDISLSDTSDGSFRRLAVQAARPTSGWTASWTNWRIRVLVEGMWTLESTRTANFQ